ncbi:MAG: DUF58 domain-containing protein [Planctomycetota bacterium]
MGLLIFTDRIELYIPPKKGSSHVLRLIRELLCFKMPRRRTNVPLALDYLRRVVRKKATVFLVSDFIETDFKKQLSLLNKRHDVIAVSVRDRAEISLPGVGLIEFQDAETGETILIDRLHKHKHRQAVHTGFDSVLSYATSTTLTCRRHRSRTS